MKKLLLLLTVALMAMSTIAAPVDQIQAKKLANNFLLNQLNAGTLMNPAAYSLQLVKTEIGNTKVSLPVYYIFNTATTYVVVAGDDRSEEILMVGDSPLDINNIPDGMQFLLDCYKEEIEYLQMRPNLVVEKPAHKQSLNAVTYGPLLTTAWGQGRPFYNQCKFTYNNRTYNCATGCPATSAAQVMNYWEYPEGVPALPAYTGRLDINTVYGAGENYVTFTYPALPATTFDWDNMRNKYTTWTTAQANAVATLMRYIGQAERMEYGETGSGIPSSNADIIATVFKDWGYKSTARLVSKGNNTTWINTMITEMGADRPVVYLGVDLDQGGHAFNVDGYRDSDGKFHVNFGWNGNGDGWFAMNSFTDPDNATYSYNQMAIIGIESPVGAQPEPVLTVTPASLSFTGCNTGQTYTKTLTITGTDLRGDVTITSDNECFTVSPSTLTVAQAQAGATVTVSYTPTSDGVQNGVITISTRAIDNKTVNVTGDASTLPTINVNPSTLNMNTTVGTPVTQTFTVTGVNLTGSVYLTCSGEGFTIDKKNITKSQATAGATVTVTYSPTTSGSHTGTVTLTSTGAQAVVNLNGTAESGPTIIANPSSLLFDTTVGAPVTKTFTVTGENLTGSVYLTCSGEGFTINKSSITKSQATAGATVTVTYSPTTYGNHIGSVTLTSNGAQPVEVVLDGMAELIVYNPQMLPANEEYITETSFRADWTDATAAANVTSYTLEVSEQSSKAARRFTGITDKYFTVSDLTAGATFLYKVKAYYIDGSSSDWSNVEEVTLLSGGHNYQPGDVNHDGSYSIADVTMLISYVLTNGANGSVCPICADLNHDNIYTIADVTMLISLVLGN